MTKYILNSGGLRNQPEKATKFFNEIVKDLGNSPKILICFFAELPEKWEEKLDRYTKGFLRLSDKAVRPIFELADPEKFVEQISSADVVYILGGDEELLLPHLNKLNLKELFKDKTVATISAGSDALVKSFWTCDRRKCMDGLGLVPIKFVPHYKSNYGSDDPRGPIEWQKAYDEISEYGDKTLPIYALEEGEFKIFHIE